MKNEIKKLLDELKFIIEHDTYALTRDNISELSWKIDELKTTILDIYKNKRID